MALYKKQFSVEQALQKLKHYCAYQERCPGDVKEKMYRIGVLEKDQDKIIAILIEEDYLNEERFAIAFAGGKFRMKKWGKIKIKYELKQRKVCDDDIKKALMQIKENEYLAVLKKLSEDKYASLKNEQYLKRKKKTMDHLMQKGYEPGLITEILNKEFPQK